MFESPEPTVTLILISGHAAFINEVVTVDPDDAEMLEDLVTVAVNEAINKAISNAEEEMGAVTGGLNIPGMF